jgi:S-methylmethionine-dependent homocysteine/selenocysteine methylase
MRYRDDLPQLEGELFLTDGGLETTLIFHQGIDLPEFAAFDLLNSTEGTEILRRYYRPYLDIAREHGTGFVLESPTWRASPSWAAKLGYSEAQLDELNRKAIALMEEIRREEDDAAAERRPIVISGCIGPEGDGYSPDTLLSADEAQAYHRPQVETFADTAADMVNAMTITYPDEAIGVVRAAEDAGIPAAISFTVETDGRLPNGQELGAAIAEVDEATGGGPVYYMINCAHPLHFESAIATDEQWRERIRAVRSNSSTKSHAELDEATELDEGDPADLAARHLPLRDSLPNLNLLGGCCGTDHRHVGEICAAWRAS